MKSFAPWTMIASGFPLMPVRQGELSNAVCMVRRYLSALKRTARSLLVPKCPDSTLRNGCRKMVRKRVGESAEEDEQVV